MASSNYQTVIDIEDQAEDGTRTMEIKGGFVGDRVDNGPGAGRMPAFIGLAREAGGFYVENTGGMTIEQALTRAGLDFTVDLREFQIPTPGGDPIPGATNLRACVGTWSDGRVANLGVAGKGYFPVQPRAAAQFGQALFEEGGANVVAAAAYGEPRGSRMFLALKMPEGIQIGGEDPHDLYLTLGNSFNRSTGLWGCVAPIRVRCTNQTTATFRGAPHRFTIRHTGQMELRINDVRHALDMTGTFADAYAQTAQQLLGTPMPAREVEEFVDTLFKTPPAVKTERGGRNWVERRNAVKHMILSGELNDTGRGTRYAALQGVTEWADHVMDAKSRYGRYMRLVDDGSDAEKYKVRAASLLTADL